MLGTRTCVILSALCLACFLSSCGYRFDQYEGLAARYSTISVPYVEEDRDGSLTAAVIKEIVRSGTFEYQCDNGALILKIDQIDLREENIGFRYDRKKRGKLTKDIIPTETRIVSVVEVAVIESASGCTVLGPVRLSASVDFDHDYYFSRDEVNVFSLGQLIDVDEANDAVQSPLNQVLAEKIVAYISQSW
jgi:hypothetical protein